MRIIATLLAALLLVSVSGADDQYALNAAPFAARATQALPQTSLGDKPVKAPDPFAASFAAAAPKKAKALPFASVKARSLAEQRPVAVFVGCPEVAGYWLTHECSSFLTRAEPGVMIFAPKDDGYLHQIATLPDSADARAIGKACCGTVQSRSSGCSCGDDCKCCPANCPTATTQGYTTQCGPNGCQLVPTFRQQMFQPMFGEFFQGGGCSSGGCSGGSCGRR